MKIEYDPEVDGAFIWFVDVETQKHRYVGEIRPAEFHDEISFLVDDSGRLLGIELLPASKYLDADLLKTP